MYADACRLDMYAYTRKLDRGAYLARHTHTHTHTHTHLRGAGAVLG